MRSTNRITPPAGLTHVLTPAILSIALLALLFAAPAPAEVAYHQPTPFPSNVTAGVHVWDCWTTNVYYGTKCIQNDILQFGGWGDVYRTYIRFDTIGLPKRVTKAALVLTAFPKGDASTPTPATFQQVLGPWSPATLIWSSQPPAANLGSVAAPVPGQKWAVDITMLFNDWQNGVVNNGLRIDPLWNWNNFSLFRSSRYVGDSDRPLLALEFTPPVPTPSFKLPLPSDSTWLVSTEAGGFDCRNDPIDEAHAGDKFFAIDFPEDNPVYARGRVPVLAAAAGAVITAGYDAQNGNLVVLDHDGDGYLDTGFQTYYGHMEHGLAVSNGDWVEQGTVLGYMGSTGKSTGPHLHFAVKYRGSGSADEVSFVTMDGLLLKSYMSECSGGAYIRRYASTNQPVSKPSANRAPTLTKTASSGSSVATGQPYSLTFSAADADGNLANVDLNWNDGTPVERKAVSGGSASVTFTRTFTTARTINWSATAYDTSGAASTMLTGSFAVAASANRAPTLVKTASTGSRVTTGQSYSLTFSAADADGNLANVDVNWNDGTPVERKAVSGGSASVTFTRAFSTARTINWSATAYDTSGAASTMLQGSFTVTAPANRAPTLVKTASTGTSVTTGQAYSLTFSAADADGNLANVDVNWNDGTPVERKAVSGGSASVTFTRAFSTARTVNWSATAYDTAGAPSTILRGSFTVTAPANRAPTLTRNAAPSGTVAAGQTVSITVTATDADGNLSNVDLNWNDGTPVERRSVSGGSARVTFSRTFSTARTIYWSSTAYDTRGAASTMLQGSFTVAQNRAPTLVKVSAPGASVSVGQAVSITVTATDLDGNLSNIDLAWNDGSPVVHRTVSGSSATATFTKTFNTRRTINWSSTAYDTRGGPAICYRAASACADTSVGRGDDSPAPSTNIRDWSRAECIPAACRSVFSP